jgi:hypothetical protein
LLGDRGRRWDAQGACAKAFSSSCTRSPIFDPSGKFEVTTTGSTRWLGGEYAGYGVIGMSVAAVGAIVGRRLTRGSALLMAGAAVLAASALALYLVLAGGSYLDETMERLRYTTDLQDENIAWRLLSWYEVIDGIIARPLRLPGPCLSTSGLHAFEICRVATSGCTWTWSCGEWPAARAAREARGLGLARRQSILHQTLRLVRRPAVPSLASATTRASATGC